MPLSRYLVRNEYGLADPDLYKAAEKDDPEALLEGVAMAGLVGVLRQLGDLAEFAAEMFHDLHEEVMATAARGHALIARVQQLEAELPSAENTLLSQTTHIPFLYNSGIDWHPNIRMDENLVTQGDMPRFVMDSYEECRGPPRLFLLDKFDVAGAGACLKRYTDPSFCKVESADFTIKNLEGQREKRTRKIKRRGSTWRNGDTPEVFPSSHAKLHQLLLEERIETGANDPERRVKLKKRPLDGFTREDRLKSYMQKFMDTYSSDNKAVREISLELVPVNVESYSDNCHSGLEIVKYDTLSPSPEPFYKDKAAYSSSNLPEVVKSSLSEYNEVTDNGADVDNLTDVTNEDLAADTCSKSRGSVGEYNIDDIASEIDNYVDALATLESETETDSDTRTKSHRWSMNGVKKMIDSDGNEDKQLQNLFLDYHSRGNSTISDDCSLLKKETDICSSSDNVSNKSAEDATAKSSASGKVNSSVTREAQANNIEEYVASHVTENMGVVNAEFKELPWISVNVGSALTKTDTVIEQTDHESTGGQAIINVVPDEGYDHSTLAGISPLDEMADASSDSSSHVSLGHSLVAEETSSHPQPEFCGDGLSSSVSSPVNSVNDLKPLVEATSDALISSVSVHYFPEPVNAPCEDNELSQINEKSSDDHDQPKQHDDSELVEQMVSLATDTDGTVEPRVSIPGDSEDSRVPRGEPLYFGYIESTEQLEFSSSENSVSGSGDESSDWIIHEPTVDKPIMKGVDSSNADVADTVANMEALSKSDSVDKVESHLSPVSSSDADLAYDTNEAIQAEQSTISFVDITQEKNAEAAVSSQTINAEYPSEHVPEVKNDFDFNHYVQTNVSSASYDCLEVQNTESFSTGHEVDMQNPESRGTDVFATSDLTASNTSSVVSGSGDNAHETCVEDCQTSVECNQHMTKTQSIPDKTIELQGVEITEKPLNALNETSQPLEYAEHIDGENEKYRNPISVSSLCPPQSLTVDLSTQSNDHKVESQLVEGESSALSSSEPAADSSIRYQNMNLSQVVPPLFGVSPIPSHVAPGDMPPLPPLPPIQWRLGRNQQASLGFGGLMQNSFGTLQSSLEPETSDNGGLRYQNFSRAHHLNPFLSSSSEGANLQHAVHYSGGYLQQPTDSLPLKDMSSEDGQPHTISQIFTESENNFTVSDSDKQLNHFSFEPLDSTLMTDNTTPDAPALFEDVIQKETTVAHDQFEYNVSPAEQETAIVDDQLEHNTEVATTSMPMQYGNQLPHGFSDPEAQGMWSTDVFSARKPENGNGYLQKKIQRPRNPLIDAVVAVDKSKLRKVGEIVKPQDKPEAATREQHLPQLRKVGKRLNKPESETREQVLPQLRKVGQRVKPQDTLKAEGSSQKFPQLRKTVERVKNQGLPSGENSVQQLPQLRKTVERVKSQDLPSAECSTAQQLPQLRKVDKKIRSQDEPKTQDETQSSLPLRGVAEKLKPQDESQVENKDWLEQIRNQSFNLKRAVSPATSRPNIQGRQTNLKVAAILEKASMIRQAMAGNDDDSDGWSDC